MRSSEITVKVFGPDPRTALERVLVDLCAAVAPHAHVPLTLQVRVALRTAEDAPEPAPLDRLYPEADPLPDERYVAEGKVWCLRDEEDLPASTRVRMHGLPAPPTRDAK